METNSVAFIVLTRGYSWKNKYKYLKIIRRNRSIYRLIRQRKEKFDHIIFQEGNVTLLDQLFIKLLSKPLKINFVDVSNHFQKRNSDIWTGESETSLGYSLMCRFQYFGIWQYVSNYSKVIRVDEDCILENLPSSFDGINFAVGSLSPETHEPTNRSLLQKMKDLEFDVFYDHRFPYTNVYIADIQTWRNPEIQQFLKWVAEDPMSLEDRWGDLPVLGIAAKAFSIWKNGEDVRATISYYHGSHSMKVNDNSIIQEG